MLSHFHELDKWNRKVTHTIKQVFVLILLSSTGPEKNLTYIIASFHSPMVRVSSCRFNVFQASNWTVGNRTFEFFTVCRKLAEMASLYSKELTAAKKKLPPVGFDLMQEIITSLGVQCLTIWAKLTFACKSKTFRSLYSHALLIIAKSVPKSSGVWTEV